MDESHINSVVQIEKDCFSSPWTYEGIKAELYNPNAYFIVFEENSKIVAYASMYSVCSEGYINNIAVLPGFRNQGIAKSLLDNLIEYSLKNSLEFLSLEVRASNRSAIGLYASKGFKNVGVRKAFYSKPKEDALIMTKIFNNLNLSLS